MMGDVLHSFSRPSPALKKCFLYVIFVDLVGFRSAFKTYFKTFINYFFLDVGQNFLHERHVVSSHVFFLARVLCYGGEMKFVTYTHDNNYFV